MIQNFTFDDASNIFFYLFSKLWALDSIGFLDIPMLSNKTEIYGFENIFQDRLNPSETMETNILSL